MTKEQFAALEALVDAISLPGVLDALEVMAHEKGAHIATNWQDDELASRWELAGSIVGEAVWQMREQAALPE